MKKNLSFKRNLFADQKSEISGTLKKNPTIYTIRDTGEQETLVKVWPQGYKTSAEHEFFPAA